MKALAKFALCSKTVTIPYSAVVEITSDQFDDPESIREKLQSVVVEHVTTGRSIPVDWLYVDDVSIHTLFDNAPKDIVLGATPFPFIINCINTIDVDYVVVTSVRKLVGTIEVPNGCKGGALRSAILNQVESVLPKREYRNIKHVYFGAQLNDMIDTVNMVTNKLSIHR